MLRTLTFISSLLLSLVIFAENNQVQTKLRQIELNEEKIDIGMIDYSSRYSENNEELTLIRTSETPNKVKIKYQITENYEHCTDYDYREERYLLGGRWVERCHTDKDGDRHCYQDYEPPDPKIEKVCVSWSTAIADRDKTLRLNFNKARKLEAGETEEIKLSLAQKNSFSTSIKYSAIVVATRRRL